MHMEMAFRMCFITFFHQPSPMPARDRVALRPLRDMHRRGGERRSASCVDFLNRALIAGRHLGRNVQYS